MSFINLEKVEAKEPVKGFHGKFVHTDNLTHAYWRVDKDSIAPEHKHPHEQVLTVLEGTFEFSINGDTKVLTPGIAAIIPPNVNHSGKAITECYLLDVFYPVREDFKKLE